MSRPTILVTGATGKTGFPTALALLAAGAPVRAVVRRRDARSEALARAGAEVVVADLFDADQMIGALRGTRRAYYCPPLDPYTLQTAVVFCEAAREARLDAVVAMSQWLASPVHPTLMTRDMWAVEQLMAQLAVQLPDAAVTVLNPGFFADNYLRVAIGMAAQLGVYPSFTGDSQNAPPSNEDIARVAAAVLLDPDRHAGRRYRPTGPALLGGADVATTLSRVLGRRVRLVDAPEWLLDKVAAYRGEPPYAMSVFRHYLEDHRQGAFAFGGPTDDVLRVTGAPAEPFEATVRRYAARPEAQRTGAAFRRALAEFLLAPAWRGYDHDRFDRRLGVPVPPHALYAMQDARWKAERLAQLGHATPQAAPRPGGRPAARAA